MKHDYSKKLNYVTLRLHIKRTKEIEEFIWKNSNYYRKLWNMYVNFIKTDSKNILNIQYKEIDEFAKYISHDVENYGQYYIDNNLTIGINWFVCNRFKAAIEMIRTKFYNTKILGEFHYKKLHPVKTSFTVENKMADKNAKKFSSKLTILDKRHIRFRLFKGNYINFQLMEDIYTDVDVSDDRRHIFYNSNLGYKFKLKILKQSHLCIN